MEREERIGAEAALRAEVRRLGEALLAEPVEHVRVVVGIEERQTASVLQRGAEIDRQDTGLIRGLVHHTNGKGPDAYATRRLPAVRFMYQEKTISYPDMPKCSTSRNGQYRRAEPCRIQRFYRYSITTVQPYGIPFSPLTFQVAFLLLTNVPVEETP